MNEHSHADRLPAEKHLAQLSTWFDVINRPTFPKKPAKGKLKIKKPYFLLGAGCKATPSLRAHRADLVATNQVGTEQNEEVQTGVCLS